MKEFTRLQRRKARKGLLKVRQREILAAEFARVDSDRQLPVRKSAGVYSFLCRM